MSNKTPSATETGSPAPADTKALLDQIEALKADAATKDALLKDLIARTPAKAVPVAPKTFCTCKRPSMRWVTKAGKHQMVCSFCSLPPVTATTPSIATPEFKGTRCTNEACKSARLRHVEGQVVCADCAAVLHDANGESFTTTCPEPGCRSSLGRRRTGEVFCISHNKNCVSVSSASVKAPAAVPGEAFSCPSCGADAGSVGVRGDGRHHCTKCDAVLDDRVVLPTAPTTAANYGAKSCPNCDAPPRAIGVDGNNRLRCTSCDHVLTLTPEPEGAAWQGDACPGCGAPPSCIKPDGNQRPHCTSCDRVLSEAQ